MGRQINFFLHPDDQNEFDTLLRTSGDVLFLPYYYHTNEISTLPDSLIRDSKEEGRRVYLIRPIDLPEMELQYIEKFGVWIIQDINLPVLHYDRCFYESNEIYRGRLYFQPKYVKDMQWVEKSADFVKWADNIINKARRKLRKHTIVARSGTYQEYVGKNAAVWIDTNKPISQSGGGSIKY